MNRQNDCQVSWGVFCTLVVAITKLLAEQEGSAPQARKADDRINNAAEQGILTTEQPCHKVKLKDSHKTPVDAANDRQDQSKHIDHVYILHSNIG